MSTISQQHVDALTWASWDFRVFPLRPADKRPHIKGWQDKATRNTKMIDHWWTRWPDANIGCVPFHGHIVIDIDPRNGGNITWDKIRAGREIPTTLINRTGSGGWHIWFRLPVDKPTRGEVDPDVGGGIDLKGSRTLVVMPGSIHPKTGGLYTCHQFATPALLPTWLEEYLYKPPAQPRRAYTPPLGVLPGAHGLISHMATTREGGRNKTLYSCARALFEEGHPPEAIDALVDAARSTGLPDHEIEQTIRSAEQAVKGAAA